MGLRLVTDDGENDLAVPKPTSQQILSTFPDGSQVLCWIWSTGEIQVAKREQVGATWGPPAEGKLVKS